MSTLPTPQSRQSQSRHRDSGRPATLFLQPQAAALDLPRNYPILVQDQVGLA